MRPLTSVPRRLTVGLAAAALPMGLLALGAAPTQAADDSSLIRISVERPAPDEYTVYARAGAALAPFTEAEQLIVREVGGGGVFSGIQFEIDNDGEQAPARLITSASICISNDVGASTMVTCAAQGTSPEDWYVSLRFNEASVPVTVAFDPNTTVDATYLGSLGRDEYYGGGGQDFVQAGPGNDTIFGGGGDDDLWGQQGDDYLEGEGGNDRHFGGSGDNLIDSEDGFFDSVVDCGGVKPSEGPFYDEGIDFPSRCSGATPPTPPPPPVPPLDPPAPGSATSSSGDVEESVQVTNPSPGTFRLQSPSFPPLFFATPLTNPLPTAPPGSSISMRSPGPSSLQFGFQPSSAFDLIIFSEPVPLGEFIVEEDGSWSAEATIPSDVLPGDHTLQLVGTNTDGETLVINIGIEVKDEEPAPTMVITGTRGEGKEIRRVFVEGESTNLVGEEVTPRYKLPGQTEWQLGLARRTVAEDGTFSWRRITGKKIAITFAAGEVTSNRIVIKSRKDVAAERR